MSKPDFIELLARRFKECENPTDLKASIIGTVKQLSPLIISIEDGAILLTENVELFIAEWFRFRCSIDSAGALSSDVPSSLESAKGVNEIHSQSGSPCKMSDAISYLADAITKINTELLALKCNLALDDKVLITPLEQTDMYILIDKVLDNVS